MSTNKIIPKENVTKGKIRSAENSGRLSEEITSRSEMYDWKSLRLQCTDRVRGASCESKKYAYRCFLYKLLHSMDVIARFLCSIAFHWRNGESLWSHAIVQATHSKRTRKQFHGKAKTPHSQSAPAQKNIPSHFARTHTNTYPYTWHICRCESQ